MGSPNMASKLPYYKTRILPTSNGKEYAGEKEERPYQKRMPHRNKARRRVN